jgi:hypothetical protein
MIDIFDIIAFVVFAVLIVALVVIVVLLGSLPGKIARKRGHPQAAAITAAGWLCLPTLILWALALVWAFLKPSSAAASPTPPPPPPGGGGGGVGGLAQMQARVDSLETALHELQAGKEVPS